MNSFKRYQRVYHAVYGEGTVRAASRLSNDVTVTFRDDCVTVPVAELVLGAQAPELAVLYEARWGAVPAEGEDDSAWLAAIAAYRDAVAAVIAARNSREKD